MDTQEISRSDEVGAIAREAVQHDLKRAKDRLQAMESERAALQDQADMQSRACGPALQRVRAYERLLELIDAAARGASNPLHGAGPLTGDAAAGKADVSAAGSARAARHLVIPDGSGGQISIDTLSVNPGDVLVVSSPYSFTPNFVAEMKATVEQHFNACHLPAPQMLFLDRGMKLDVMSPSPS